MQIKDLVRQEILNLSPYRVESIRSRKPDEQIMKLDLNENLTISREIIGNLHRELCENVDVRLYPPPHGAIAVKAISEFFGFNKSQIFVGNGVDGVLDSLMRVFVQRKSMEIAPPRPEEKPAPEAKDTDDLKGKLQRLKEYYDEGLIDEEEYKTKKKQLLESVTG